MSDLEARVAKLERTAKRRGLVVLALAVLCVGLGAKAAMENEGDKVFGTVVAEKFQVISPDGKASAALAVVPSTDNSKHPQGVLALMGLSDDGETQYFSFYHPNNDVRHVSKPATK